MNRKFHKRLSLQKITISIHQIYGGIADNGETVPPSSAYDEPTEIPRLDTKPNDPILLSYNSPICI
ncbi:hypothetical protein [Kordia sp.]|uniref:hypothetical protein n=1 Tax=Kordia sp. TaxID=1965332 RepID=UPI003B5C80E4